MTAQSVSQYEELAKLQAARAEKEEAMMVVQSELTATTGGLPDQVHVHIQTPDLDIKYKYNSHSTHVLSDLHVCIHVQITVQMRVVRRLEQGAY